jgi:hypothetical protein
MKGIQASSQSELAAPKAASFLAAFRLFYVLSTFMRGREGEEKYKAVGREVLRFW